MKHFQFAIVFIMLIGIQILESSAQGSWTRKADFGGNARYFGSGMATSNLGYIGLGSTNTNPSNDDFWSYNPALNSWSTIPNFYGDRIYSACFNIEDLGYVCSGSYWDGTSTGQPFIFYQDMWAYDHATNSWIQKANFPGIARNGALGFEIFGKGYVGMGAVRETSGAITYFNDLYAYDPIADSWTQKASLPASGRGYCIYFSIGRKLIVGLGVSNLTNYLCDIWEYNSADNTWIKKNDFPGPPRKYASSFVIGNKGYVFGGSDASTCYSDLWEYNPDLDTWTQKEYLPSSARYSAIGFSINGKGYIGTGKIPSTGNTKEFWEYTPSDYGLSAEKRESIQPAIFPDPAHDFIRIKGVSAESLRVFNEQGQLVIEKTNITDGIERIEISSLKNGFYYIEAIEKGKRYHLKFIKQ